MLALTRPLHAQAIIQAEFSAVGCAEQALRIGSQKAVWKDLQGSALMRAGIDIDPDQVTLAHCNIFQPLGPCPEFKSPRPRIADIVNRAEVNVFMCFSHVGREYWWA